MIATNYLKTIS